MRLLVPFMAFLLLSQPCVAQPTVAIWVDHAGTLVNAHDVVPGATFDIVFTLDSDGHDVSFVSWGATEPSAGLVKVNTIPVLGSCGLLPEACFEGNFEILVHGECHAPGDRLELLRVQYGAFVGIGAADDVLVIEPNDGFSSIDPTPAFVDCDGTLREVTMGGSQGGTTSSGVSWPDGALILNPTRPVPVGDAGFSVLKARY